MIDVVVFAIVSGGLFFTGFLTKNPRNRRNFLVLGSGCLIASVAFYVGELYK